VLSIIPVRAVMRACRCIHVCAVFIMTFNACMHVNVCVYVHLHMHLHIGGCSMYVYTCKHSYAPVEITGACLSK
jgi:hypothetical protein